MYPIYKNTYERQDGQKSDYRDKTNFYKEHVVMWAEDLRRSIDYLDTGNDMDTNKTAYYGASWGGEISPIMLAVEKRIKGCCITRCRISVRTGTAGGRSF